MQVLGNGGSGMSNGQGHRVDDTSQELIDENERLKDENKMTNAL